MTLDSPASLAELLASYLFSPELVRAVLSAPVRREKMPWQKVVIRPVLIRGQCVMQIQRYETKRCDMYNASSMADPLISDTISLPFRHLTIHLKKTLIQARVTKRGHVMLSTTSYDSIVDVSHDRKKKFRLIPEDAPFLTFLGVAVDGKVIPSKQRKYRQVNEFVRAMTEAPNFDQLRSEPVRIVDFGCGNAYLTFAIYHYLHIEQGLRCEVIGVDRDPDAVARNRQRAQILGWQDAKFEQGNIADAAGAIIGHKPAIAVSLHACDTATDDALGKATACQAQLVLAAPCCHHNLQAQLGTRQDATGFNVILGSDLLRERLGDVLTDSARVALLRLIGYQVHVLQFATLHDSAKNLLIRAFRTGEPPSARAIDEYRAFKRTWQVTPYLEHLLDTELQRHIS